MLCSAIKAVPGSQAMGLPRNLPQVLGMSFRLYQAQGLSHTFSQMQDQQLLPPRLP